MLRIFIAILFTFCANQVVAQNRGVLRSIILNGDTIPHIWLEQVHVKGRSHNANWYRRYNQRNARLEFNVRKVYPYACMAARKINEIENKLSRINRESDRKKILKEEYSQLMKTFKEPLSRLSITQGKILIKLIDRETKHTSFAHIREYRGTINAYFWQSIALLFGNNLKASYDAHGEDSEIEYIVQKILEESKP